MMRLLRRFLKSNQGIAATEFALIAPVMITIFIGVASLADFASVDKKVTKVAYTVADLVTQEKQMTDQDALNVFRAAELIMEPYGIVVGVGVASVRYDPDGVPYIDWEENHNGGSPGDALLKATGLGVAGESVIVVGVQYSYSPILMGPVDLGGVVLEEYAVQRPRRAAYVVRN